MCSQTLPHTSAAIPETYCRAITACDSQDNFESGKFARNPTTGCKWQCSDIKDTIYSISSLTSFYRYTGHGSTILMELVPPILPGLNDHLLEIRFITEVCKSNHYYPTFDREQLITRGICILELVDNPPLQCECLSLLKLLLFSLHFLADFYYAAGLFFVEHRLDKAQAMQFYKKALKLSEIYADSNQQCNVLMSIAWVQWITGDYGTAQIHAAEAQRQSKSSGNGSKSTMDWSFVLHNPRKCPAELVPTMQSQSNRWHLWPSWRLSRQSNCNITGRDSSAEVRISLSQKHP
jgi:hypothetical protein